jgi:hypothetical protein
MISGWKELRIESFEETFLKNFWDLKLKDVVIELKSPIISHHSGYAGVFIGSLQDLDLSIFEELSVDFPGISELRKVKNLMLDLDSKNVESVDNAYNSVLRDIVIGRDFPLFMLTAYSAETAAHLYPIGNNESDKLFLDSIFSYATPKNSLHSSLANRSVLYVKRGKDCYTGYRYLENYCKERPDLFISYRLWDKSSFNQFAKLLSGKDFGNANKVKEFMLESIDIHSKYNNYKLIDENEDIL